MSEVFNTRARWVPAKRVALLGFNGNEYPEILPDHDCALEVGSKGNYFIERVIEFESGKKYVLHRYDYEKDTVFYRRIK